MLEYLIQSPKKEIENPPLLILLHGYGSNEADLFSFAPELPEELLIISARAPLSLGFGGFAWYSINFDATSNSKFSNLEEARQSIDKIEEFIDEIVKKYKVNSNKIFLLGFSQGAILSYALAMRNPQKIKNILALSGYINTELTPQDLTPEKVKELDFFISHGTVDQVLPIEWVRKSLPILDSLKISYNFNEYPIGHGINPQNFSDFKNWIIDKLK
jgi:phospholipase/carboxylesterase